MLVLNIFVVSFVMYYFGVIYNLILICVCFSFVTLFLFFVWRQREI